MKQGTLVKLRGETWEGVVEFTDKNMVGVVKSFPVEVIGKFSIYDVSRLTVLKSSKRTKRSLAQLSTQELINRIAEGRVAFINRIREKEKVVYRTYSCPPLRNGTSQDWIDDNGS